MSSLNNPLQSTVFIPPNSSDNLLAVPGLSGNPAGYGTSQVINFVAPSTIPIGFVVPIQVICPKPAPLWCFSTETAADKIKIFSVNNQSITLQIPTSITGTLTGFNNGYFQPSAGESYIIYFEAGVAKGPNAQCFELQAVIENTIGQYVDLGSITPTARNANPKATFTVGTTVALNTTSTLANSVYIDVSNWPVNAGRNTIATGIALLTAQANSCVSSAFLSNAGMQWTPFQIVGGQTFAFEIQSQRDGYWTGRVSIAITQVGVVALPPTIPCTSAAQHFISAAVSNAGTHASSPDIDLSKVFMSVETLNTKMLSIMSILEDEERSSDSTQVSDLAATVQELCRKNEAAHTEIFRQLAKLSKNDKRSINPPLDDDYHSVIDSEEQSGPTILPMVDSSSSVIRDRSGDGIVSRKRFN